MSLEPVTMMAYLARVILIGSGIVVVLILFLEWMFHDLDD